MRRHRGRDPFRVGLVVLIVGGIATYLGVTRTNPFHHGYKVHALFQSALSNGVHPGSPVRIAGVNVGKVTGVRRGPGTTVDVTMEVDSNGRPIHRDATIKARPRIFLEGNFFLDVKPGTAAAPELADGATIPLTQTAVPVQFDELLSTFTTPTRVANQQLFEGLAKSLRHGGAQALRADYEVLPGTLRQGSVALRALRGSGSGDLAAYVTGQARLSGALDRNRRELAGLLAGFRTTMDALAARQQQLGASVPAFERLLAAAPPTLTELDRALPAVRDFSVALRPAARIAPPVLDHAAAFLTGLRTLLAPDRLGELVTQLGPSVDRLKDLEGSLPPLLDFVKPVSQCTTDNVLPILNSTVDDGALSAHQPVWQEALHGPLGLLSSQQNFGGDGYSTRYSFGVDETVVATKLDLPGELIQLTGSPLLGARPAWTPGHQPPYRPDVPCETQKLQSTKAETVPPPPASRTRTIHLQQVEAWPLKQLRSRLRGAFAHLRDAAR